MAGLPSILARLSPGAGSLPYIVVTADQDLLDAPDTTTAAASAAELRELQADPDGWVLSAPELGIAIQCPYTDLDSVEVDLGPQVREGGGFQDEEESAGPTPRKAQRMSLSGEFVARYATIDLTPVRDLLIILSSFAPELARPPLVTLTYGAEQVRGYFSKLSYKWPEGLWQGTRLHRKLVVDVEVVATRPAVLERVNPSRLERSTSEVSLRAGQTFESLALDHLGDPDDGIILRRLNPQIPATGEGPEDVVLVPTPGHSSLDQSREPVAPALRAGFRDHVQAIAEGLEQATGKTLAQLEAELGLTP